VIRQTFRVLVVLWAGSLWSTLWVAWIVFHLQNDRHLAGVLASQFFAIETYLGIGVATLALLLPGRARFLWGYIGAALLAVNHWLLGSAMSAAHTRGSVAGLTFGAWHGLSAALYLVVCLMVLVLVWQQEIR
jgi:hypothetical protein